MSEESVFMEEFPNKSPEAKPQGNLDVIASQKEVLWESYIIR